MDKPKTTGLKAKDLRPCDCCGEKLDKANPIQFYVVRVRSALIDHQAINQIQGTAQILGGHWPLAEVMAPTDKVAQVIEDGHDLMLCQNCVLMGDINLGALMCKLEDM